MLVSIAHRTDVLTAKESNLLLRNFSGLMCVFGSYITASYTAEIVYDSWLEDIGGDRANSHAGCRASRMTRSSYRDIFRHLPTRRWHPFKFALSQRLWLTGAIGTRRKHSAFRAENNIATIPAPDYVPVHQRTGR
jgi:hypothetical protein